MKQVRRAILCLSLSLITTIVLALLLAAFRPVPMYPRRAMRVFEHGDHSWLMTEVDPIGVHDLWWSALSEEDLKATVAEVETQRTIAAGQRQTSPSRKFFNSPPSWGTLANSTKPVTRMGSDTAFGFPLPCLWYSITADTSTSGGAPTILNDHLHGGLLIRGELSARGRDFSAIPLRPLWSRLAINTLAFASLWWLILFLPDPIRRALRRRRNHCPACNYDLRATPAESRCPECGSNQGTLERSQTTTPAL